MGTPENLDIDICLDLDDQADGELTLMEAASLGTRIMLGQSPGRQRAWALGSCWDSHREGSGLGL